MKIAVIPARGGSKRIPRKNVRCFAGQPMIFWSIAAAIKTEIFDHIIVSTDDPEIADTALKLGAEVPFMRPESLSDDHTPTAPVVAHAIEWVEENKGQVDAVCCIYATAPFIQVEDVRKGLDVLSKNDVKYVFPVTSFAFPVQRGVRLRNDGKLDMLHPEHAQTRSQDLEEAFHDVGQFYWGKPDAWKSNTSIIGPDAMPIIIPRYRAQDIDTEEDWIYAEMLFEMSKNSE